MSKTSKPSNKSNAGISGTSTTKATTTKEEETNNARKSILQQIVEADGTDGLNQKYVDYVLSEENGGGFGADYGGIRYENGTPVKRSGTDSSRFRATAAYIDTKKDAKSTKNTDDRDPFIEAYIDTRLSGGSPEEASEAGRKAAGLQPAATGSDSFNLADFRKQYWSEPEPGSVKSLTEEEKQQAIANSQAKHSSTSQSGYEAYRQRYLENQQAEQTPMFSEQQEASSPYASPPPSPAEVYARRAQETQARTQNTGSGSLIGKAAGYLLGRSDDINILQGGKTTTQWGSTAPSGASAGADGSKPGLADQSSTSATKQEQAAVRPGTYNPITKKTTARLGTATEENRTEQAPITQYFYPEADTGNIRFQSTTPFEDWQRSLIDEINEAQNSRDFQRQAELMRIYGADDSYDAFMRDRYSHSLPEGTTAYQSLQDAISAGDAQAYKQAQNTLRTNGYSQQDIDNNAAELIHQSDKTTAEKEKDLRDYLGISASDAQATAIMWWWNDSNGKDAADADGNGRLKQAELGEYLRSLENSRTLSEAQAAAIWKESFPSAKTDYSTWKGKQKK